ncbi:unnamed protein product, partial [Ectocarpus sp. 12 AP-2014]
MFFSHSNRVAPLSIPLFYTAPLGPPRRDHYTFNTSSACAQVDAKNECRGFRCKSETRGRVLGTQLLFWRIRRRCRKCLVGRDLHELLPFKYGTSLVVERSSSE